MEDSFGLEMGLLCHGVCQEKCPRLSVRWRSHGSKASSPNHSPAPQYQQRACCWLDCLPTFAACARIFHLPLRPGNLCRLLAPWFMGLCFSLETPLCCKCILFILCTAVQPQCWIETTLRLFGHIRRIPDEEMKCLPRHAARAGCPTAVQLPVWGY